MNVAIINFLKSYLIIPQKTLTRSSGKGLAFNNIIHKGPLYSVNPFFIFSNFFSYLFSRISFPPNPIKYPVILPIAAPKAPNNATKNGLNTAPNVNITKNPGNGNNTEEELIKETMNMPR